MAYSDKVLDHYNNPRNVGSLDKSSSDVGTGIVGAPECGDGRRHLFRGYICQHVAVGQVQRAERGRRRQQV